MPETGVAPEAEAPSVLRKILKWGNYEPFGLPVGGTRFIPMKSPLTSELQESLAQQVMRGSQTPPPEHADVVATPSRRQPPTPASAPTHTRVRCEIQAGHPMDVLPPHGCVGPSWP